MTEGAEEAGARTLTGIGLLDGLDPAVITAVERRCHWRLYKRQEPIIDRDSENRDAYFVVSGAVRIVNYSASGREVSFDDIKSGGYFGEMTAIDGEPRSAAVVALTDTLVASIAPEPFVELVTTHPTAAHNLMIRLTQMVRQSTERIMDLSTLGANNRIHAEILRQAKTLPGADNQAVIRPIPVHSDIASRVSTTRETVARVLGDLTRKEIVKREGKALIISDVARLIDMVEQFEGA